LNLVLLSLLKNLLSWLIKQFSKSSYFPKEISDNKKVPTYPVEILSKKISDSKKASTYPIEILPKKNFKIIAFNESLEVFNQCCVVRRSAKDTIEDTFDEEFGEVQIHALFPSDNHNQSNVNVNHVIGYSMNLLGGYFLDKHLIYKVKSQGQESWEPNKEIYLEKFEECHTKVEVSIPIFFNFKPLNEFQGKVKTHNKDVVKSIYKTDKASNQKDFKQRLESALKEIKRGHEIPFKTYLRHVPVNLNYWHIQLEFEYPEDRHTDKIKVSLSKFFSDMDKHEISEMNPKVQLILLTIQNLLTPSSKKEISELERNFKIPKHLFQKDDI